MLHLVNGQTDTWALLELDNTYNISTGLLTGSYFSLYIDQVMTGGEHGGQRRNLTAVTKIEVLLFVLHPVKLKA